MTHPIPFYLYIKYYYHLVLHHYSLDHCCSVSGHWGNHLYWHSSLHLENSQLIYSAVAVPSSFSDRIHKIHLLSSYSLSSLLDRKHRIHLSSSYFLVFFVPAPCYVCCTVLVLHHRYCSVSALHHGYCSVSAMHHGYCSVSALHHGYCSYFSSLQLFHCGYCKTIWMSSGMIVTHLACMA